MAPIDEATAGPPLSPWRRLHAALLPDYNTKATVFWCTMVLLGGLGIAFSAHDVAARLNGTQLTQVIAGVSLAMLAGFFPLRIPGSKNSFVAGEIFIFTLLLLHGPAAAALASAFEALVGSWRTSKRWSSRIASPAMAAVAMLCAGSLFGVARSGLEQVGANGAVSLLLNTTAFALVYFVINTLLVTLVPKLKRNQGLMLSDLFGNFGWVGISYGVSACVAVLVYLTFQHSGGGVLLVGAPIIALLLSTMHLFFRQQEAAEAMRKSEMEALAREQEQATRHVQELRDIAFQDSLTGLPNRRRLLELLAAALHRAADDPRQEFALLFLDFDRFKLINDSLGHSAGDDFLVQVSRLLLVHVRPGDSVARLGGDEFAVLIEGGGSVDLALALAVRVQHLLAQPIQINGVMVSTSASIGITTSSFGYTDPNEVLRDADIAMYQAKAGGKARHALFDISLRERASQRLLIEAELRTALAEQDLTVDYQPVYHLGTGTLLGFEALARWRHPRLGRVDPATFIPIAEESGLIISVTDLVLHTACHQLKRLHAVLPAGDELTMHVNVSSNDIAQRGFVERVTRAIAAAQLQPRHLTLELTENILMASLEDALPMLTELNALGFRLSVDDFGTGCSSLTHLSRLPLHSLKIDRSFVANLDNPSNQAIVKAILSLATALGKSVVAEGIETAGQFERLRALGCRDGQGYFMSRPLPAAALELQLREEASGRLHAAAAITPPAGHRHLLPH
ncbi:putative bifunctional diguanylate cyclase/phosphodiesterase [Ideonella sp. BN130291]|uniref:putative bifunctional diguanylate cyclase/phosphodiesterase n=1 Tax=Ideonella sp. BN130291 TaxID=3112940 RepID=UPI002E267C0B|nr:EAL domain-containing protein [Ideonella sp. BN130291]